MLCSDPVERGLLSPGAAGERTLIVCHCRRITDRQIRKVVREGASSVGEVARACGAVTGCGGCATVVHEIVNEELDGAKMETITSPLLAEAG